MLELQHLERKTDSIYPSLVSKTACYIENFGIVASDLFDILCCKMQFSLPNFILLHSLSPQPLVNAETHAYLDAFTVIFRFVGVHLEKNKVLG